MYRSRSKPIMFLLQGISKDALLCFYNLLQCSCLNDVSVYIYMRHTSGGSHYEFIIVFTTLGKAKSFRCTMWNWKKQLKKMPNFKQNWNFDSIKNENRKVTNNLPSLLCPKETWFHHWEEIKISGNFQNFEMCGIYHWSYPSRCRERKTGYLWKDGAHRC